MNYPLQEPAQPGDDIGQVRAALVALDLERQRFIFRLDHLQRAAVSFAPPPALGIEREVIVYDYVDSGVTMLARMALKRQAGYRSLGYEIGTAGTRMPEVQSVNVSAGNAG